jgi:hypothetical protein
MLHDKAEKRWYIFEVLRNGNYYRLCKCYCSIEDWITEFERGGLSKNRRWRIDADRILIY